jgi:hypothetical protein
LGAAIADGALARQQLAAGVVMGPEEAQAVRQLVEDGFEGAGGVEVHANDQPEGHFQGELPLARGATAGLLQDRLHRLPGEDPRQQFQTELGKELAVGIDIA